MNSTWNTDKIAAEIDAAAYFTGTYGEVIDTPIVAGYILGLEGVAFVSPDHEGNGQITRASDDSVMVYAIEHDWDNDTLTVAGWSWAVYDGKRQVVAKGGDPINDTAGLATMLDTIADWAVGAY